MQACGGGGFSPGKLRNMLLGLEKKRKEEEEELGSTYNLRSQALQSDEAGKLFMLISCFLGSSILRRRQQNRKENEASIRGRGFVFFTSSAASQRRCNFYINYFVLV